LKRIDYFDGFLEALRKHKEIIGRRGTKVWLGGGEEQTHSREYLKREIESNLGEGVQQSFKARTLEVKDFIKTKKKNTTPTVVICEP